MRYLVITESRQPLPPEMAAPALRMFQAWLAENRDAGKIEQAWTFAGQVAGAGIANVESHDELDAIMGRWPLAQFSDIKVYPLADLDASLENALANIQAVMEAMGVE